MATPTSYEALQFAESHLERVQIAWDDPTDWADLSIYGLYCLEAALNAAHIELTGHPLNTTRHYEKARIAKEFHEKHSLPDIHDLLRELNETRKAVAYGDVPQPKNLNAEQIAVEIEEYVVEVRALIRKP